MKLRPDYPRDEQLQEYAGTEMSAVVSLSELPARPSLAVGTYSTFLYDMVAASVPVAILDTSLDYGRGMVENGLAEPLRKDDLCAALARLASTPEAILTARREQLTAPHASLDATLAHIAKDCGIPRVREVG